MGIKENVERILERIEKACHEAGRSTDSVKLLAASKTRTPKEIEEAFESGIKLFGENRVQEAKEKIPLLSHLPIQWHMIGHLQTNKVKKALELFDCIQTVDRESLVRELDKRLLSLGRKLPVLIEVKLSPEETKHGCPLEDLERLTELVLSKETLELKGLMTVPPYFEDIDKVRPYFAKLRELKEKLEQSFNVKLPELSMGMSHDFEAAILEGATIVRIGTAIFGERNY